MLIKVIAVIIPGRMLMNSAAGLKRARRFWDATANTSFRKQLILLFAVSFGVHALVAALFIRQPIALDDMYQYDMLARSLSEGNGYRWYSAADVAVLRPYYAQFLDMDRLDFPPDGLLTTFRAPGYPFFLAFLYLFVPTAGQITLARLAQAALAGLLAPLAALLGRLAGFSTKERLPAALGMCFYPILLFYPIGLASENLYIPLGAASLAAVYLAAKRAVLKWIILAGLLCGLLMLTRSIFAVFVLLAGVWLARFNPLRLKAALIFLGIAFGLCLPWAVRNSIIMGKPAFVENSGGYNLFIGYHPQGNGGFVSKIAILPMNILDDGERERYCMREALRFLRDDPLEGLRRVGVRAGMFLGPEDREFSYFYSNGFMGEIRQPWITLIYALLAIPWGLTLLMGAAGLWLARKTAFGWLAAFFLLGYALPHLLIIAEPRFHLVWAPVLIPFAVHGWRMLRRTGRRQWLKRNCLPLAALLVLVLAVYLAVLFVRLPGVIALLGEDGSRLRLPY